MSRILVADDDGHIREVVRFTLAQAGHEVVEAKDGAAALAEFAKGAFDVVVLDIVMPDLDGLEVCKQLRASSRVPIVFLSSRDEELDRVLGLELGADDYVGKPFSPRELLARIKAVLRRVREPASAVDSALLRYGELAIDRSRHRCLVRGVEVVFTVTELALLSVLLASPGRVFSRDELVNRAYGDDHVITERTVDSHVRRIRQKLALHEVDVVETVYGVGYRLREGPG
jgi:two-component system, OmpR family, response regulator